MPENEKADDSQEDQSVSRVLVLEIPKRTPHGDPSQVISFVLTNPYAHFNVLDFNTFI